MSKGGGRGCGREGFIHSLLQINKAMVDIYWINLVLTSVLGLGLGKYNVLTSVLGLGLGKYNVLTSVLGLGLGKYNFVNFFLNQIFVKV